MKTVQADVACRGFFCCLIRAIEEAVVGDVVRVLEKFQSSDMDDEKVRMAARNMLTGFLEGKRLRKTPERYAILDKVLQLRAHFDIMALHRAMEEDAYHVSRATIYNTMELLVECGLVRKHQFGNRHAQFEMLLDATNHHHLMCTECGRIKEVKDQELIRYMNSRKYPSFSTQYFSLYVYGICSRCARKLRNATSEK